MKKATMKIYQLSYFYHDFSIVDFDFKDYTEQVSTPAQIFSTIEGAVLEAQKISNDYYPTWIEYNKAGRKWEATVPYQSSKITFIIHELEVLN